MIFKRLLFAAPIISENLIANTYSYIDRGRTISPLIPGLSLATVRLKLTRLIADDYFMRAWVTVGPSGKAKIGNIECGEMYRAVKAIFYYCEIEKKKKMIHYASLNQRVKKKKNQFFVKLFSFLHEFILLDSE